MDCRAGGTVRSQIHPFCATSGRYRHSSTAAGILASIREAAIRVAIQAHLPEEARRRKGRERRRERDEREQIYEREKVQRGGGVACSRSVTEIELESKEGTTGTERRAESSERRDGDRALRQR